MSPQVVCGALVLSIALHWTLPPVALAQSGNCSQVLSRLDKDLGSFQKDLTKSHVDFISDDVASATKEGIAPLLEHSPTLEGAARILEHKEQLIKLQEKLQEHQATFDDLVKCINTKGCSLLEHAKRSGKAVWEYVESMGEPAAAQRVKDASALLKTYTARLQGTAQGGISGAVSCMNDYELQAKAQASADPVQTGTPPGGQSKAPPSAGAQAGAKSGGGSGKFVIGTVAAIGAGAALGLAVQEASKAAEEQASVRCTSQESTTMNALSSVQNAANGLAACGTSQSCFNARWAVYESSWSSFGSALSGWCSCMGTGASIDSTAKAAIQQAWAAAPAQGFNPGTLPSCFR